MRPKKGRSGMTRFNPKHVKALRAAISKCPNPVFRKMVEKDQMNDADILEFALRLSHSYFTGELLELAQQAQAELLKKAEEQSDKKEGRMVRRAILQTLGLFGLTATFEDGFITPKLARSPDDPEVQLDSVQRLVDTGLSVKAAVSSLRQLPAPGEIPSIRDDDPISQHELVH